MHQFIEHDFQSGTSTTGHDNHSGQNSAHGSGQELRILRDLLQLLPAGVTDLHGDFDAGDPVELVGPDGVPVARGLVGYDAADLPPLLGRRTSELAPEFRREIVHRDDVVLLR